MDKRRYWWVLPALLLILWILANYSTPPDRDPNRPGENVPPAGPGRYFFCFWNVENLFDDQDDGLKAPGDKDYDPWFSEDREMLGHKLSNLADVLVAMNGGRGPDILALAEVESDRAAELLQETLNRRLDANLHYHTRLFKGPGAGRHIGCAFLSRVPAVKDRTTLLGNRQRILETRFVVAGHPLVAIASHWSSRLGDEGENRAKYGDVIHGRFRGMYKSNPAADVLVCGDFNDGPTDESVTEHLRATGDRDAVLRGGEVPLLFNLAAALAENGEFTLYYRGKYLFDQICVSPGMLDAEGWSVVEGSAAVVKEMANRNGNPNRFGGRSDRRALRSKGASDHFPVTVTLEVR